MALSNPQYESIIKKYERQRDAARDLSEARRKQVCDTIPGFRELSDSVSSLSVASARQLLDGDQEALPRLHRRLKEIPASGGFWRNTDFLRTIWTLSTAVPSARTRDMC